MKKNILLCLAFLHCLSCSDNKTLADDTIDMGLDTSDIIVPEERDVDHDTKSDGSNQTSNDCLEIQLWFCPPLDEVWQKTLIIDQCEEPPVIISESDCELVFECDPSVPDMGMQPCLTSTMEPGHQSVSCVKGKLYLGDCTPDCSEEICDGVDNDCDGEVDEDQLNACGLCGYPPPEICDGIDNDCDGTIDEDLIGTCKTSCDTGLKKCVNGKWSSCTAPVPSIEICDGQDNDCDGEVDENLQCICSLSDVGLLVPCASPPLACGQGYFTCECETPDCTSFYVTDCLASCYFIDPTDPDCDPTLGTPAYPEKCNAHDENCNDQIDEDLSKICYTGDPDTLNVGTCLPGIQVCDMGLWGTFDTLGDFTPGMCENEVLPATEICDGLDNDCDGATDYGDGLEKTDILFIVDISGSMDMEINSVFTSLSQFVSTFSDESVLQWAIITAPVTDYSLAPLGMQFFKLSHPLDTFEGFMGAFAGLSSAVSGSYEMLYDALYVAIAPLVPATALPFLLEDIVWDYGVKGSIPEIDQFDVGWRPDADRVIILFTDEPGQSYIFEPEPVTKPMLENLLSSIPDITVHVMTQTENWDWTNIAQSTGGMWFELTYNPTEMYLNLITILDQICLEGNENP